MKDKNSLVGFILLAVLMMLYLTITNNKYKVRKAQELEEQRLKDSIEQANVLEIDSTKQITTSDVDTVVNQQVVDSLKDMRKVIQYGDFAMASNGEEQKIVLENDLAKFTFSNKGGRITEIELKDYDKVYWDDEKKVIKDKLLLFEDQKNKFTYKLPVKGASTLVSTEDLFFKPVQATKDKVVFRAFAGSPDKYFEQTYSLNEDYILEYDVKFVGLNDVLQSDAKIVELEWVNYLDKIERASGYARNFTTAYYKLKDRSPSHCSCTGSDKVTKEKPTQWVSHSNQFFNTALIADEEFPYMQSETGMLTDADEDLKVLSTTFHIPVEKDFGMKIYSGPNEFNRLRAFGNGMEDIVPYGSSILGTINRWVIRPLFNFFSSFIGNKGIVILIVTFLVKMLLFPLTYKMLYSQSKMAALKPQIESIKKRIGEEDKQAVQVETMKLYRETGVNPLGGCMPMVIQMPIWIALYRFFPASIEFRQASFLWADDLASYDVFAWLPGGMSIPFYGAHISLFTILWAFTTVIYTYYNSKHMDLSANPAMKYMQYLMPIMFLFFFNSLAAGLTAYMLFSNLVNIAQTVVTKNFIIDNDKVLAELEANKVKPKKPKSAFQERLSKAMEEAQKAQEERQKTQQKNRNKKKK